MVAILIALGALFSRSSSAVSVLVTPSKSFRMDAFVGSDTERVYATDGNQLTAILVSQRRAVWRWKIPVKEAVRLQYAFMGNLVYVLLPNHHLTALNALTGKIRWNRALPASLTVPSSMAANEGRLVVGYSCAGAESSTLNGCLGPTVITQVGLNPESGQVLWQLKSSAARQMGVTTVGRSFSVGGKSSSTTANPDPQSVYQVLELPPKKMELTWQDVQSFDGPQEQDPRPRYFVNNNVFTIGDPETKEVVLDGSGNLILEILTLPSVVVKRLAVPVTPRPNCELPKLQFSRIEVTPPGPLLIANFADACGLFMRYWWLGNEAKLIPNQTDDSQVFYSGKSWWTLTPDSRGVTNLSQNRIAFELEKTGINYQVVSNPPYLFIGNTTRPRELQIYNLNTGNLIETIGLKFDFLNWKPIMVLGKTVIVIENEALILYPLTR